MRLRAGTSGFSYDAWKGPFYPEKLPTKKMLGFYAEHLSTVEINSTFYRMPKRSVLEGWSTKVPEDFVFALKASRRITHIARLEESSFDALAYLWTVAGALGPHLGPILFQLPPTLAKRLDKLRSFVGALPEGLLAAFEFRHESWFDDEVYEVLRESGHTLCLADTEGSDDPKLVATADWGYVRLRREAYSDDALRRWLTALQSQGWNEAFVFFKHEDEGVAPRLAARLLELYA